MSKFTFKKLTSKYQTQVFSWLDEPHVKEFWDNSQEHRDDIQNFINGRIEPSSYIDGRYEYWVGLINDEPFSLLMTIQELRDEKRSQIKQEHFSKIGNTYSMEFMIGHPGFIGKGLAADTLKQFMNYFKVHIDNRVDTFFIDPDITNPRAKHIYEKAGFEYKGDFIMDGEVFFAGCKTHFLVKKI